MYSNIASPNLHHALDDSETPDRLPGVLYTTNIGGSPSKADWETIAPWTLGVLSPLYQEVAEGMSVFDGALATHASYSDAYLHHGPLPSAHESLHPDLVQPALHYPPSQVPNTGADDGSLNMFGEMEPQSVPEMTYMNGSPSIVLDCGALTAWSGPIHVPDHDDHCTFCLASAPKVHASFRGLAMSIPVDEGTTLGTRTVDVYETDPSKVPPLPPLLMPINWRKIPQPRYPSRTGDMAFLQSRRVTFSVNGVPGFNMQRALDQAFVGLDGRDDPVLENANGPASCRLLFPGYPMNTPCGQIAVRNWKKDPAPIPKSKLAYEVAKRVRQYLGELVAIPVDPSADPQWTVEQGWMKFERMYLVSISWVSRGSVQPEIWVDTGDLTGSKF